MSRIAVDFEGSQRRVSSADAARQAKTMRLILDKLRTQPGVVLCDEVGMGKTYVALGVIAQYLKSYPRSRVLVLTPSSDLAEKWLKDLERFRAENVRPQVGQAMRAQPDIRSVADMLGAKNKSRVWVVPVSLFFRSHRREEQKEFRHIAYHLISRAARLPREERKILWRRLGGTVRSTPRPRKRLYWNGWRVPSFKNRVHDLIKQHGYDKDNFNPANIPGSVLRQLQDDIRWLLIRVRLRRFSLIVADEAHHFRNPDTKRYRSLEQVFARAFRDMLFLTATPFQLGPDELEHILRLFRLSSEHAAKTMEDEAQRVTDCAREYRDVVRAFEGAWKQLSDTEKQAVCDQTKMHTAGIVGFCTAYERMQEAHHKLQSTLSKWVIRNVKDRPYRHETPAQEARLTVSESDQLPFAVMQRLLHEYQRKRRTFSATQNVSLTSSWEAFRASAVMRGSASGASGIRFYRKVMKALVSETDTVHPKFAKLLEIVNSAIRANEKVLVFTCRIETVRMLQSKLERALKGQIYRDIGLPRKEVEKRLRQLGKRSYASRDTLWLLFQENCFRSYLKRIPSVDSIYTKILRGLHRFSSDYCIGLKGSATSPHWQFLSYLCQWAVFSEATKYLPKPEITDSLIRYWASRVPRPFNLRVKPLRNLTPIHEEQILRRHCCNKPQLKEWISKVLNHRSIWDQYTELLAPVRDIELRDDLLDSLTRVLLVPEVVAPALRSLRGLGRGQTESAVLRAFANPLIKDRITRFLADIRTLPEEEVQAYVGGLATEGLVSRASGRESSSDRQRHRYGFNTPFRPYVLVASEVMQEGLDLHRECSRIVHFDLAWNPARLEQRVGRIDRLGSRVDKQLLLDRDAKLYIHRQYIPGTIDERMYRRVHDRERWFKFILGHRPEWETDTEDEVPSIALPERFGHEFRIQLGIG